MTKVKDMMTTDVVCVSSDTPVYEAAATLLNHEITGMPVVADDMKLLGIITEKDVLRLHTEPDSGKGRTVEDFMTTPAIFFDSSEDMHDVCYCLIANSFRRVPVTEKGKVVGILSRPDAIKYILQQAHEQAALERS